MKVYTFSEARQRLATLLNQAWREGPVRIRRRDGQEFLVQAAPASGGSPLDVPGLGLELDAAAVVALVDQSRRSTERLLEPAFSAVPVGQEEPPQRRRVSEKVRRPRRRRPR